MQISDIQKYFRLFGDRVKLIMNDRSIRYINNIIPFVIVSILILFRDLNLFFRAEFWAEDCLHFFKEGMEMGFASLFTPIWGYHFLLGRIIAFVATFFPVFWTPFIYIYSTLIILTITIGYFSREGFTWLIRSKILRVFVCMLIATGPGNEVFFGLCVSYAPLVLLAFLVLLEKPWVPSKKVFFLILFLTVSTGIMFSIIPLLLYLYYRTKYKTYVYLLLFIFLISFYNVFGTTNSTSLAAQSGEFNIENFFFLREIIVKNFFVRLFMTPFLGQSTLELLNYDKPFWLLILGYLIFTYYFIKQDLHKDQNMHIILLFFFSIIGVLGITGILRTSSLDVLLIVSNINWGTRYFFLPGVAAYLFWGYIISKKIAPKQGILITILILYIFFSINVLNWSTVYNRPDLSWKVHAWKIQKALDDKKFGRLENPIAISFPVHPSQWMCTVVINPKNK